MVKVNARPAPPSSGERAAKKPRLEDSKTTKFTSIPAIQAALNVNNKKPCAALIQSLTNVRNQISLRHSEVQSHLEDSRTKLVAPNDERLLLVEEWCKASPGLRELFDIWNETFDESAAQANGSQGIAMTNSTASLVLSILTTVFALLSTSYAFRPHGIQIVKNFTPDHWRKLNAYITGGQGKGRNAQGGSNELILVALRLLTVISEKWDPKRVFESFTWESKALPKLFTLRRKSESSPLVKPGTLFSFLLSVNQLTRSDIRTAFILFLVSFLSSGADSRVNSQTKIAFLSTPASLSTLLSLFKTLHSDHADVIKRVLEVCWEGVWCDIRVSRSLKVGAFGDLHGVLGNLLKLYDNTEAEGADYSPADLVHHFLLATCTRPGVGLCFKDRGWYPREGDEESLGEGKAKEFERGKIYNIILAQFLKMLKVTDDPRQQELALKILKACPSSRGTALYNPVPPSVGTILGNVVPTSQNMNLKNVFTKGLQFTTPIAAGSKAPPAPGPSATSTGNLVQHTTALALIKCLDKLASVEAAFEEVAAAVGEGGETEGQWTRRLKEVMREARRRLPEFQVVVAFCSAHLRAFHSNHQASSDCLPEVVEGARFDVGKILIGFEFAVSTPEVGDAGSEAGEDGVREVDEDQDDEMDEDHAEAGEEEGGEGDRDEEDGEEQGEEDQEPEDINVARRLHRVTQLHILRFLKESSAFVGSGGWAGKVTGANGQNQTHLYTLFTQFLRFHPSLSTSNYESSIHTQLASLVKHILGSTLLFQDDPEEVDFWLNALPFGARRVKVISRAKKPEDLQDGEEEEMISVTVYPETPDGTPLVDERESIVSFLDECYIEEMASLSSSPADSDAMDVDISHQILLDNSATGTPPSPLLFRAKLLAPSDLVAIITFVRKVLLGLLGKANAEKNPTVAVLRLEVKTMSFSVRREIDFMRQTLHGQPSSPGSTRPDIDEFLDLLAHLSDLTSLTLPACVAPSKRERMLTAFELVDWLRLLDSGLNAEQASNFSLLSRTLEGLGQSENSATLFGQNTTCGRHRGWTAMFRVGKVPVDHLLLSADAHAAINHRSTSVYSSPSSPDTPSIYFTRIVHVLLHNLLVWRQSGSLDISKALLMVLGRLLEALKSDEAFSLLLWVALRSNSLKVSTRIDLIQTTCLDFTSVKDRELASQISNVWRDRFLPAEELDYSLSWIKFLDPLDLLSCLESTLSSASSTDRYLVHLLQVSATPLRSLASSTAHEGSPRQGGAGLLDSRLPLLFQLQSKLSGLDGHGELGQVLEELIATALEASLPLGLSGVLGRWAKRRSGQTSTIPSAAPLMGTPSFTPTAGRILNSLLYSDAHFTRSQIQSKEVLSQWVDLTLSQRLLQRLFDVFTAPASNTKLRVQVLNIFVSLFGIAKKDEDSKPVERLLASCSRLNKRLGDDPPYIAQEWVGVATWVQSNIPTLEGALSLVQDIVETGLQYTIRQLASEDPSAMFPSGEIAGFVRLLSSLVESSNDVKCNPSTMETLLSIVVEQHLHQAPIVELVNTALKVSNLKPLAVNRYLQAIVQHPRFYKVFSLPSSATHSAWDAITSLLYTIFHLHPSNTCQVSHVEPLVRVYRGTLSPSDQRITSIFHLFERQRKLSVTALLSKWSNPQTSSPTQSSSSTSLEALQTLDPAFVLRTALAYPYWRNVDEVGIPSDAQVQEEQVYDPVFICLLFGHVLSESPPSGNIGWIELFRTNVVGVLVRSMSSRFASIRKLALSLLAGVWKSVQVAELHEKEHLLYVLAQIKNLLPPSTPQDTAPVRIPSYITLFLFHSLRGIFNPAHFVLDATDVPMLYSLLYSSSDDHWRKERGWILRFLADGMLAIGSGSQDWKILKRRHTWDLLASMYQSTHSGSSGDKDRGLRQAILGILVNITRHQRPCSGLILKSGLLSWMEMQLQSETTTKGSNDSVAWIKVIENVLLVLDVDKLEGTSLQSEWQASLWRCIALLLRKSASAIQVLPYATRVILRLVGYSKVSYPVLVEVMNLALERLEDLEATVPLPDATTATTGARRLNLNDLVPPGLHNSYGLHDMPAVEHSFVLWGRIVEVLWKAVMLSPGEDLPTVWDKFTSRLLIWRAFVGAANSPEGEWARVQSVRNIS
ncbi:ribosome 60S biogenesis N-terminal-domain-containing protein [Coprinopsis sp. MPI-PUGE-AT-0042]|nr:ribosome 60S biogenesis N-terminal-domain-containing protein [Coprinopsis sp. MPI-PUGE-AT-0042]